MGDEKILGSGQPKIGKKEENYRTKVNV